MLKEVADLQIYSSINTFSINFLNKDISFIITCTLMKLCLVVFECVIEGKVSQFLLFR